LDVVSRLLFVQNQASRWPTRGTPAFRGKQKVILLVGSSGRREELGRAAVHLLARDLLDALAEHPLLAEGVAQSSAALAVELVLKGIEDLAPAAIERSQAVSTFSQ
jgi:hypothetical protein